MKLRYFSRAVLALATILALSPAGKLSATSSIAEIDAGTEIQEHLNAQLDLDLPFIRSDGKEAPLRSFIHKGKPAILTPIYYSCPSLCSFTLNGLIGALNQIDERIGLDYSIITYSINPDEDSNLAAKKAANYYKELRNAADGERGWYFLTASESASKTLSDQIGFKYKRDGEDYIHAAVFVILSPEGRISRYFYGVSPNPRDIRFALVEASEGKFGTAFDRLLLSCFRWDHLTGRYSFVAWNLVRYTSIAVVIALFCYLILLRIREVKGCENF